MVLWSVSRTTLLLFTVAAVAPSAAMPLVMLTDAQAKDKGAVCLDGTNPGIYYRAANTSLDATKWVLYEYIPAACVLPARCCDQLNVLIPSYPLHPPQLLQGRGLVL